MSRDSRFLGQEAERDFFALTTNPTNSWISYYWTQATNHITCETRFSFTTLLLRLFHWTPLAELCIGWLVVKGLTESLLVESLASLLLGVSFNLWASEEDLDCLVSLVPPHPIHSSRVCACGGIACLFKSTTISYILLSPKLIYYSEWVGYHPQQISNWSQQFVKKVEDLGKKS